MADFIVTPLPPLSPVDVEQYRSATIIANDLDSMTYRIESLPPCDSYDKAKWFVRQAKDAIIKGASEDSQSKPDLTDRDPSPAAA